MQSSCPFAASIIDKRFHHTEFEIGKRIEGMNPDFIGEDSLINPSKAVNDLDYYIQERRFFSSLSRECRFFARNRQVPSLSKHAAASFVVEARREFRDKIETGRDLRLSHEPIVDDFQLGYEVE